jgi:hypothetical protein
VWWLSPEIPAVLGVPPPTGRSFDAADLEPGAPPVVLLSDGFWRDRFGADRSVLGRTLIADDEPHRIIGGVVGNVLKDGLHSAPVPEVFIVPAHRYAMRNEINLVLRTAGDPAAAADDVRQMVHNLRPDAAVAHVATLASQVSASVAGERLAAATAGGFAALALALAAIGLYGVLSCGVAARVREIGVRSALGANRSRIVALVVREGTQAVGIGLVLGLVSSALATRLLEGLLFGIPPLDPVSFLVAPLALGVVAIVASALPAWRAARVDPVRALRVD